MFFTWAQIKFVMSAADAEEENNTYYGKTITETLGTSENVLVCICPIE